jgi:hypothetical protein
MVSFFKRFFISEFFSLFCGLCQLLVSYLEKRTLDNSDIIKSIAWFVAIYIMSSFFIRVQMHGEIKEGQADVRDQIDKLSGLITITHADTTARIASASDEVNIHLTAMTMVEHCGRAIEARKRLIAGLKNATEVYNVYINTISKPAPAGFDRSDPSEIRNLYASMLQNRGVNWQDIIGGNTARYKERFAGMTLPATPHANFHCHALTHAYPSVNFTVFGQHGMPKEVMFGFGLHDAEQNDDVFWSRDKRVVGYFESLFNAMRAKTTAVDLNQLIQP